MDFIQALNQLGKIAGRVRFEPIWKPYEGDKPVWVACEGLTEKDARIAYRYMQSFLTCLEQPFDARDLWEIRTPAEFLKGTEKAFEGGKALITLGAPLFRFAYWGGKPPQSLEEADVAGAYKVICYASNFSHIAVRGDKERTEEGLVKIRKKQKRMLWQNAGDFDLQVVLELTEGLSLDFAEECLSIEGVI